jgi:ABC-type transport system involved in multi-copper enzyme maturation permease subunit
MWLLFRAEWLKMTGNRWLTGCLLGVWPLAAGIISLLVLMITLLWPDFRENLQESPLRWTDASLFFWFVPNFIVGRMLIVGFSTALFAGEYQWGTWKNLVPRRGRVSLILMKFVTLAAFIVVVFSVTSVIWVIGIGISQLAATGTYPPALNDIPQDYWGELALKVIAAYLSTLIVAGIAALVALVMRSILMGVIVGILATIADGFFAALVLIVFLATDNRFFPGLYRFTISYNVDNLLNWANSGQASPVLGSLQGNDIEFPILGALNLDSPIAGNSLWGSIAVLVTWAALFIGLTAYSFYRQDLSS